jgi:hypothetical protein
MEAARAQDEASETEVAELPPTAADLQPKAMPKPAPPLRPPANAVAPATPAAPLISLPAPVENRPARIDEMVVCSARGEVLYEWQCPNSGDRVSFLEFLSRKSLQLGEGLNLGEFDRLEIEGDNSRVVAQLKKDRGVFVRATKSQSRITE